MASPCGIVWASSQDGSQVPRSRVPREPDRNYMTFYDCTGLLGCHNKLPQSGDLIEIHSPIVLEAGMSKSSHQQGWFLLRL